MRELSEKAQNILTENVRNEDFLGDYDELIIDPSEQGMDDITDDDNLQDHFMEDFS